MFFIENKKKFKKFVRTFFLAFTVFYFSYHLFSGDKGVLAMIQLRQEVNTARAEVEEVKKEKSALEHRVNMMYSHSLDLDLLDEQARKILGQAKKDEIIYLHGRNL